MNWTQFAIGILLTAIKAAVKNPASIQSEKGILLEIRNDINMLFPGE